MMKPLGLALLVLILAAPSWAGKPDLVLRNGIFFDASPRGPVGSVERLHRGDTIFVEGMVVNRGDVPAEGVVIELRVDGRVIGRSRLGIIRRGMQEAFSIAWVPVAEGTAFVRAVLDPDNRIAESDERNNNREEALRVTFLVEDSAPVSSPIDRPPSAPDSAVPVGVVKPDLVVYGSLGVWPRLIVGRVSTISATVENRGAAVSEPCDVDFRIGGARVGTRTLPRLRPGERATVSMLWTPPRRGRFHLDAQVDPRQVVAETNETNNSEAANVESRLK